RRGQALARVRAAGVEEAAPIRVGVDVDDAVLAQLVGVLLRPLRRSEETFFLAVPGEVDDRPLRLPAAPGQLADRARLGQLRDEAADRILRAIHPGVGMIAAHDPL